MAIKQLSQLHCSGYSPGDGRVQPNCGCQLSVGKWSQCDKCPNKSFGFLTVKDAARLLLAVSLRQGDQKQKRQDGGRPHRLCKKKMRKALAGTQWSAVPTPVAAMQSRGSPLSPLDLSAVTHDIVPKVSCQTSFFFVPRRSWHFNDAQRCAWRHVEVSSSTQWRLASHWLLSSTATCRLKVAGSGPFGATFLRLSAGRGTADTEHADARKPYFSHDVASGRIWNWIHRFSSEDRETALSSPVLSAFFFRAGEHEALECPGTLKILLLV